MNVTRERTLCERCEHVTLETRKQRPRYWQCARHKRFDRVSFLSDADWSEVDPHLYCRDVNGGMCPLFEPRREVEPQ